VLYLVGLHLPLVILLAGLLFAVGVSLCIDLVHGNVDIGLQLAGLHLALVRHALTLNLSLRHGLHGFNLALVRNARLLVLSVEREFLVLQRGVLLHLRRLDLAVLGQLLGLDLPVLLKLRTLELAVLLGLLPLETKLGLQLLHLSLDLHGLGIGSLWLGVLGLFLRVLAPTGKGVLDLLAELGDAGTSGEDVHRYVERHGSEFDGGGEGGEKLGGALHEGADFLLSARDVATDRRIRFNIDAILPGNSRTKDVNDILPCDGVGGFLQLGRINLRLKLSY